MFYFRLLPALNWISSSVKSCIAIFSARYINIFPAILKSSLCKVCQASSSAPCSMQRACFLNPMCLTRFWFWIRKFEFEFTLSGVVHSKVGLNFVIAFGFEINKGLNSVIAFAFGTYSFWVQYQANGNDYNMSDL